MELESGWPIPKNSCGQGDAHRWCWKLSAATNHYARIGEQGATALSIETISHCRYYPVWHAK